MLMHMTDKLLICEMKLMIIQFKNNVNRKSYEMFIKNKIITIMIIYYKKIEINKKIKIIYYYLLYKIKELIFYHI